MQTRTLHFTSRITKKGGLIIDNPVEFHNFMEQFKTGMLICKFEVHNKNSSKGLIGYYHKVVVPNFQKAFFKLGNRYSLEKTEEEIRKFSPLIWNEFYDDEGVFHSKMKKFEQLDSFDQVLFIEHIKQIAAEDFNFYISDPIFL